MLQTCEKSLERSLQCKILSIKQQTIAVSLRISSDNDLIKEKHPQQAKAYEEGLELPPNA